MSWCDTSNEASILFVDVYSRNIGLVLKQIKEMNYTILYYWRPSKLIDSNHFSNKSYISHPNIKLLSEISTNPYIKLINKAVNELE